MAFAKPNVLRTGVLLLAFLLLCLLVLYGGWSSFQRSPDGTTDDRRLEFTGKQVVGSSSSLLTSGVGSGSRASKPQFQFINRVVTTFDKEAAAAMLQLVTRKAPSRDPEMIEIVRHLLDPPPTEGSLTLSKGILDTPQSKEVDALFNQAKGGFFVECGALDGERASNSLPFEFNRQWTGILIEANPYYYTQLLGKNRNVWSINACLSPYNYATHLQFESSKGHTGRVVLLDDEHRPSANKRKRTDLVACFPLETILLALNQTRVDYFSLDVEGLELEVLKTIPFDRIDIRVLTVEYMHGGGGKDAYKSFMESKGFRTHKELKYSEPRAGLFAEDYVFVKQ